VTTARAGTLRSAAGSVLLLEFPIPQPRRTNELRRSRDGVRRTQQAGAGRARLVLGDRALLVEPPARRRAPSRVAVSTPVWRLVSSRSGHLEWRTSDRVVWSAGALVPPDASVEVTGGEHLVVIHLEGWRFGLGPAHPGAGPTPLPTTPAFATDRLWRLRDPATLDAAAADLVAALRHEQALPAPITSDRHLLAALRTLPEAEGVTAAAAAAGWSRSRFRTLVHAHTGTSPTRVRTWQRLRAALGAMTLGDLAEAAAVGGFADQAHFTRTATRLVGLPPGLLRTGIDRAG
jgi:AraC-like DNA-binding protein